MKKNQKTTLAPRKVPAYKENEIAMEYVVTKIQNEQVAITADSPKEAIAKAQKGEGKPIASGETWNATPRPAPRQQPAPMMPPGGRVLPPRAA